MKTERKQANVGRVVRGWSFAIAIAVVAGLTGSPMNARAQATFTEIKGTTPVRETTYAIRVPQNWNGTLINDLDYVTMIDGPLQTYLLGKGYAMSGTARRADRTLHYDPAREMTDMDTLFDIFQANFGKPKRIIQYGQSGGGHLTLLMAENQPNRIDGAVASCAHGPIWQSNSDLDLWFSLKALLGRPDLVVSNLPADTTQIRADWKKAVTDAQTTPQGRARIALAYTIAQYPTWAGGVPPFPPQPNPHDPVDLENNMYLTILGVIDNQFPLRFMYEQATPGPLSWNTGVDYGRLYRNGYPEQKDAVSFSYQAAGLSLNKDIATINQFPRVEADPNALKFWSSPERMYVGKPKVPVLRIHTSGDVLALTSLVEGYDAAVERNGFDEMYRTAFVHSVGHCTYNVAEQAAAFETLQRRLDTGVWGRVDPQAMNALAASLIPDVAARYFDFDQVPYNRSYFASVPDYLGRGPVTCDKDRNGACRKSSEAELEPLAE